MGQATTDQARNPGISPPVTARSHRSRNSILAIAAGFGCCSMPALPCFSRHCWMMPIRCMLKLRGRWSRGMTGLPCTPMASATWRRRRSCIGAWPPASLSSGQKPGPPGCRWRWLPLRCSWLSYSTGRRLFASEPAGFYAALVLLTSFGIFIYTRILIPDVMVCLWLSLAILLFWISLDQSPARALDGLGIRGGLRPECAHQGTYRDRFPSRHCLPFPFAAAKPGPLAAVASLFQFAGLPGDCGAVAHCSRDCQPVPGQCAWVLVVLLRQRTCASLSQPARSTGLRHGSPAALLGPGGGMAGSLDRFPAFTSPESRAQLALVVGWAA